MQAAIVISCRGRLGELLGELTVIDRRGRDTLDIVGGDFSISELGDYLVRLEGPSAGSLRFSAPIEPLPTSVSSETLLGLLGRPPGLGVVRIEIGEADGTLAWRQDVSVRPEKLRNLAEFEGMVADLCRWRTTLALDLHAHSSAPWVWSDTADALTPEERLVVLRAAAEDNKLYESLDRVERSASVRLNRDVELVSLGREEIDPFRLGRHLNGPGARSVLPALHPLAVRLPSIPTRLPPARKVETVDTPENQFVKVAVRRFREAISAAVRELPRYADSPISNWAREAERRLGRIATSPFFSKISWPACVSLGSPVLQRRDGYRSVLKAFLDLRAGFSMPWDELSGAVFGETRDVPTIYEFWCLLQLRNALEAEFGADLDLSHFLVSSSRMSVCRGAASHSRSPILIGDQPYALTLHYNRTFHPVTVVTKGRFKTHGAGFGTWSKPMKPDFTISLHPWGQDAAKAAACGLLRLVHLDAKYRLKNFIAGGEATHVPDDLDKMHAYAASINHSRGAYALFPGDSEELLAGRFPGEDVGAIPLAPGRTTDFGAALRAIIEKATGEVGSC